MKHGINERTAPAIAMWRWMATVVVFAAVALALATRADARPAPESFADLAEELLPTVVNISTTSVIEPGEGPQDFQDFFRDFFERRGEEPPEMPRRGPSSLGSGFIIDETGYVVTNAHVIAEADEITVRLHDDRTYKAEVVGRDEKTDLALLKIEADEPLPAADWGDSNKLRIGDWVLAIGNPFGLGGTVTAGIVSALSRDINAGPYDDFIQTDASINRGNSGGPTFNIDGKVIGINTAIFSPSGGSVGIGFAVPSAMAQNVISQLREFGEVRRGWLGVRIQTVTEELAEGLRLKEPRGALVASVTPGGPADKSGIKQGDVILKFDGQKVEDMRSLPRMVAETRIGKGTEVVVWRKGERKIVEVTLGELDEERIAELEGSTMQSPEQPDEAESSVTALGLDLAALTPELRETFEIAEDTKGVAITGVESGSSAAEKGLRPGDVVVEVDQEPVSSPDEVKELVESAKDEGYRVVTLLVLRQGNFQWVAVRLGDEE